MSPDSNRGSDSNRDSDSNSAGSGSGTGAAVALLGFLPRLAPVGLGSTVFLSTASFFKAPLLVGVALSVAAALDVFLESAADFLVVAAALAVFLESATAFPLFLAVGSSFFAAPLASFFTGGAFSAFFMLLSAAVSSLS